MGLYENLLRGDGTRQISIVVSNPTFNPNAPPAAALTAANTIRVADPHLVAPYNENTSLSLEKTWPHGLATTFSWDTTKGNHLFRSRNINAPYPGTPLPADLLAALSSSDPNVSSAAQDQVNRMRPRYPYIANVMQLESSGKVWSNNFNRVPR